MIPRPRHARGTALVMAIIVSLVITGLISALAWVAGEQSQRASTIAKMDQAFYSAEAGAQRVQWFCKNNQLGSISSPLSGSINGVAYSVSWNNVSGSTIQINASGAVGSTSYAMAEQVTPPAAAVSAMASKGIFNNKTVDVIGDVQTGAKYNNTGNSGSIVGNVIYGTTALNTGQITGSVTKGTWNDINMNTLEASLIAAAGTTYNGDQTNVTFNFNTTPGTNKIIYVNGNVKNPTFIGSGTIYADGTFISDGFGTAGSPVNVVASGRVTTHNNVTIYGSIYSEKSWRHGKTDFNGIVYVEKRIVGNGGAEGGLDSDDDDDSNDIDSGQWSFKIGSAPWFDTRNVGGSNKTIVTAFAGPNP